MKHINIIFPLIDHLYIFQNLEYETVAFLKWFIKNPFKRNLQRKHKVDLTSKASILLLISLLLIVVESLNTISKFGWPIWVYPLVVILYLQFSPIFLSLAQLILWPFEWYSKKRLIEAAKIKLEGMTSLKVVGITGSFAKTSTKDMLYTLLWKDFRVVKSPKSYNTLVSVARTILADLKPNTEVFIAEMDAYHTGDIDKLSWLARPNIGLITAIAPQHLERFGSMDKLAKTQFEIAANLRSSHPDHSTTANILPTTANIGKTAANSLGHPEATSEGSRDSSASLHSDNGILVLNSQDEWTMKLEGDFVVKKVFFGLNSQDVSAKKIRLVGEGTRFELHTRDRHVKITISLFGEHHVLNFLAASAIALKLGLSLKTIQQRAKLILPSPHRLEISRQGNLTIIDNTYNTNPTAYKASLKVLAILPGSKKILITPGLVELGNRSFEENALFAKEAAKVADQIMIVGKNARAPLLKGLKEVNYASERTHLVKTTAEGLEALGKIASPGSVVLLENDLPDQYF